MKKFRVLSISLLSCLLFLTACGNQTANSSEKQTKVNKQNQQQAQKETKSSKAKNIVEIASNNKRPLEKKKIKVSIPTKAFNDPRASNDDRKLAQEGVEEYNNTTQEIYTNSVTVLSYDSYYNIDSQGLVIAAVFINNRAKPITNVEFEGNMQIMVDKKAKVIPREFELPTEYYDPIKPGEGTIIVMSFRVLNYTKDIITFNKKEIVGDLYNFKFKELSITK